MKAGNAMTHKIIKWQFNNFYDWLSWSRSQFCTLS